jgi:ADP-ribosylglycohydrolase
MTRRVLERVLEGIDASAAAKAIWEERGPEVSAGNGSVAYSAPIGAAYARRPERLGGLAPALSALTHYDQRCRTAVLAISAAVAALVGGGSPAPAVSGALALVADREGGEELEFLVEAVGGTRPIDGPDMGFCLYAAGAGLQAVNRHQRFEEALRAVVGLGGDTGANAAVAGALMGAAVGRRGLPADWLGLMAEAGTIEEEAKDLAALATAGPE